tara:strand:- start:162 stop:539 length:378 start_codon:yes stop_codon:yes gene_type:complete
VEQFFANWTGDFVLKCIHRRGGQRDVSFFFPLLRVLLVVVVLHRRFFYLFFIAFFSASLLCVFVASIRFNLMENLFHRHPLYNEIKCEENRNETENERHTQRSAPTRTRGTRQKKRIWSVEESNS